MLDRRGFIIGLIAAPAIVRIDNLMPVRLFEPKLYERWLCQYLQGMDQLMLRRDVSSIPLPIPVNLQTPSADMIARGRALMGNTLGTIEAMVRSGARLQAYAEVSMSWPQLLKRRNENEVAH